MTAADLQWASLHGTVIFGKVYSHSCADCWSPVSLGPMHFQCDCQSGNETVNYICCQKWRDHWDATSITQ